MAAEQPPLFCDGIHRHSDDTVTNTVTEDLPINKPKNQTCDDCDGSDGVISSANEVVEMAREYFSRSNREQNNGVTIVTPSQSVNNTCKTPNFTSENIVTNTVTTGENTVTNDEELPQFVIATRRRAGERGLVAKWSPKAFGFTSIHDPTTGEWHDLRTKDAPAWAKGEAMKRKELYKGGNRRAYDLRASEMREIWELETAAEEETPAISERGLVYEDYLGEGG